MKPPRASWITMLLVVVPPVINAVIEHLKGEEDKTKDKDKEKEVKPKAKRKSRSKRPPKDAHRDSDNPPPMPPQDKLPEDL